MLLTLGPLAIVESPGLGTATQTGESGLVEEVFQRLVPASHPFVVAGLFTGVVGGRHQPCVGGEMVSTLEATEVPGSDQELGTEVCGDCSLRTGPNPPATLVSGSKVTNVPSRRMPATRLAVWLTA